METVISIATQEGQLRVAKGYLLRRHSTVEILDVGVSSTSCGQWHCATIKVSAGGQTKSGASSPSLSIGKAIQEAVLNIR